MPIQLGAKRRFPLTTNERPSLDLRTPGAAGRSRAIPIQNVDLTPNSPSEEIDAVWSPDGTKILFASNGADTNSDGKIDSLRADATYHIWIMNADGSNQRQLTNSAGNQVEPAWSPNGLRIAYASDEGGDYDIYLLTLTDNAKVKLTLGASSERHPTWAAGGDKVAFMSDKTGLSKIWSMKTDGTVPQMLSSDGPSEDRNPVWSPDGQTIAFQSNGTDANGDGTIDGVCQDTNIWVMSYFGSQQRPITAYQIRLGVLTDKEPAWSRDGSAILFSSDRKDTDGDGVWDNRGDFDVYTIPANQPETATTSVATRLTQRSATEFNALTGNETHPSLAPDQTYNPKVMFVSDQSGTQDIWITSIDDITKPRLTELPSVSPRLTIPGDTVTITARVSDQESGVRAVYAQFRDPDDAVTDSQGVNHKVFYVQPHHPNTQVDGMPVWTEVDSQMVNAQDYTYEIPPYQPPLDELSADYSSLTPSDGWLRLYDDGKHNDGAAGDGLYGNTWKTPSAASDYYLDIIAYDNAGNWKIYDGVWGFSTQQFTATHNMLLVMDYAQGQKFMSGDQARFNAGGSYLPTWFPVESYYTHNPTGTNYNPSDYRGCVINTDILDASGLPPSPMSLGIYSLDTFRRNVATEGYDLWRVICRGRISPDVIASYTPRQVEQPDFTSPFTATQNQLVADRGIFWVSPYTGNLWVGEGTILDTDTQTKLVDFMNKGGRLAVTGQDVAWALSRDGTASSPLLTQMGVKYVDDASYNVLTGTAWDLRMFLTGVGGDPLATEPWGVHFYPKDSQPTSLDMPTLYSIYMRNLPGATPSDPWRYSIGVNISSRTGSRETAKHSDNDAAGNQYWIDSITPIEPAVNFYTFKDNSGVNGVSNGLPAVRKEDTDTHSRSAFFAFGLEGVSQEYTSDSNFNNHTLNLRNHLVHNTICWMRTGTIYGVVQLTAGLAPAKGVLVRAYENKSLNNRTIVGQAFTREDGTYEIQGLPSSVYRVEAILPGYTYDHAQRDSVHGAGRTEMNFKLSEAPPGSISGRVTNTDGTTAIAGASVTITLQGTYKGQTLEKTVQTDQFGVYSVPDLPTGLYQVKSASDGYQEQTYASLVQVNPGSETANINFVMGGAPGGIIGTVTRQSDGQPVAGATVELRSGTTLVASTTTDDNGKYAFPSVAAGTYEVMVTAGSGILATSATVTVTANTQARCNIAANTPEPAFVAGKVTDASGNLVSGALIEAMSNGNVVKSTTSGAAQTTGSTTYNFKLTGLSAGSYTIQVSKAGYSGSSSNVTLTESQQLYNVNFTLQSLHVFSSGLSMVSAPYDYSDQDAADFLGLTASQVKMAQWVSSRYAYYPEAPSDRFRIGRGYFIKSDRAISVTKQGRAVDTNAPYAISLSSGWNMIGNPFPFIVNWFDTKVKVGAETLTLQDAISRDLIKNALWTYGNGEYRLAFQLVPWEGYWVKATQDITLLIPNVAGRSAVMDPYRSRSVSADSWTLQLAASAGSLRDTANYLGVSQQAKDEYDTATDMLEAPATGMSDWVQLTFPHRSTWGRASGDYAIDMHSAASQNRVWEFEVSCSIPNSDVTVSWPNMGQLPKRYTAILEDVDAGVKRYLRSLGGYTFRSNDAGSVRRFRLSIVDSTKARLAVNGMQMVKNRAGGAIFSFDLSEAASVRMRVMDATGKTVRQVAAAQVRQAGANSVTWDGRDSRGNSLGYGLYFYEVEAVAEDGRTVRQSRPFLNVR